MTQQDVTASRSRAWALLAVMATSGCAAGNDPESAPSEGVAPSRQALDEKPTWAATGSMSVARQDATATRLLDGRVLVVGGRGFGAVDVGDVFFESAELFDPAAGTFSLVAANMAQKRTQHAAIAIAGGKVLVAGGIGGALSRSTAEIFDPQSATWTSVLALAHEHWGATLTLLPSGRVLLAGGNPDVSAGAAEIFDPTSSTRMDAAPMSTSRRYHTATLLLNGRVLVTGGQTPDEDPNKVLITPSAEIFDPVANTWSKAKSLLLARTKHTATRLEDGTVLVVGGSTLSGNTAAVERYDPVMNEWTDMPLMIKSARATHSATLLDNGAVLVAGGLDATSSALRSSELFDPKTKQWVVSGLLDHGRLAHMAETLADGAVLVTGGEFQSSAEIYRPADHGKRCAVGPQCASGHCVDSVCCTEMCSGRCVTCALAGAEGTCSPATPGTDPHRDCGQGRPCDDVCSKDSACVSRVGQACAATACSADRTEVIEAAMCSAIGDVCTKVNVRCAPYRCDDRSFPVTAGCLTQCRSIDDCAAGYACDTEGTCRLRPDVAATEAATCSAGPRPPGSPRAVAAWLAGIALLASARRRQGRGRSRGLRGSVVVVAAAALACALTWSHAPLADEPPSPVTKSLSSLATSSMSTARWHHVTARLPDGRVLVAGGVPFASAMLTAEIYDPNTGMWTSAGPMLYPHDWPVAATLCDGRVFVGGKNDLSAPEAELYDPATNAWIPAGKMKFSHIYGTATLLQDCRLLLTGGFNANTQAEVFYPETKSFKGVGVMNEERFFHTATLLADGRVLAAGGGVGAFGTWHTFSSASLFDPATGLWTKAAKMTHPRRAHTATLLPDGNVLVAGGNKDGKNDGTEAGTQLDTAEIYDPLTNTWKELSSKLVTARTFHTAALMPGGAVLLFGGLDGSGSASRQVEGYFEGTWRALDPMLIDRYQHASAMLDEGRVLLAGGVYQATAEVYRLTPKGQACDANLTCDGGHCVDGVCCNEACDTGCRRCNVPGNVGTCSLPCADDAHAWACADGSATCANGTCEKQACEQFRCDAEKAACGTKCRSVEDCAPGYACTLEGACVTPPDVSSADTGACRAAAPDRRWGAGLGVGAVVAAMALLRRRGRRRLES